jgi:hypothetical protein
MDRQELDARIRQRRPGEGRVRRGTPIDGHEAPAAGYVPFEPAPEDAQAVREPVEPEARVDNTPPDFDRSAPPPPPPADAPAPPYSPTGQWQAPDANAEPGWAAAGADHAAAGEPDDDLSYPYSAGEYEAADDLRGGGRGSGMLPVIGFVVLAILALGVGAALAGILGGGGVAAASATPTARQSSTASGEASVGPTASADQGSSTPEPTDGPVTFPDGAQITVQPCATKDMSFDGCAVDGSTIRQPTMWVWVGFKKASGSDTFTLELRNEGQTIDQQEQELGSILDCPGTCSGYLIGAAYRDLGAGDYQLIVRRNDDFADSATFTVKS